MIFIAKGNKIKVDMNYFTRGCLLKSEASLLKLELLAFVVNLGLLELPYRFIFSRRFLKRLGTNMKEKQFYNHYHKVCIFIHD